MKKNEVIGVGSKVRSKWDANYTGTVEEVTKSGQFLIRFLNQRTGKPRSTLIRYDAEDLVLMGSPENPLSIEVINEKVLVGRGFKEVSYPQDPGHFYLKEIKVSDLKGSSFEGMVPFDADLDSKVTIEWKKEGRFVQIYIGDYDVAEQHKDTSKAALELVNL